MRFIHIADIHASRERLPQTLHILSTLTERARQGDIDFILFAGDFWDSTITATKGSGFSDIIQAVRELEKHTFLFFIYGTPTHEPSGSLDAFDSEKTRVISGKTFTSGKCRFVFIPEPRRSNYITESVKETDDAINKDIQHWIEKTREWNSNLEKEIVHKPLIVVYHGEVKGAVYQNGVSASSPTAIPKELLQSLNADYYALGHIHLPQEVFKNAWYSGSACPKDFGETHDGGYNLVTIENGETKTERVSFGLPTYETFNVFYSDFLKTKSDFTNKHIRLQFEVTKEEKKTLNIKQIADGIKERTHALSVKLEPTVTETEAAAKSEVVKHKSLVEKMTEYAKEKSLKMPKRATELLKAIEDDTLTKLNFPQHSFELLSLSLRGAIGIRDGQHKEDFELNFEKYDDGVICLIGRCGTGKSCLLENCHPYPCMLTRDGTLKEHFYLKDSHRILTYKDENGLYYKISMLIDGKNKTGSAQYFVETSKDRESWKTLPETDGSLESYRQWVNGTFGSLDVFLRTAFFAKEQTKNVPDISATTKGERMELLSKLAGTEHLKEVSVIARDKRKEVEKQCEKIEAEIESYAKFEQTIKDNEQDIISWQNKAKGAETAITIDEKKVAELRAKDAEYQKVKAVSEANKALYEQYKKEYDETKDLADTFSEAVNNKDIFQKVIDSKTKIEVNTLLIQKWQKDVSAKREELEKVTETVIILTKAISERKLALSKLETKKSLLNSQIADVSEVCPTCGAPLSEHKKKELSKHIESAKNQLAQVLDDEQVIQDGLAENEKNLKKADTTETLKKEISELESKLSKLQSDTHGCADFLETVDQIYTEHTYDKAVDELKKLGSELALLESKMAELADTETAKDVSAELAETERRLQTDRNTLADLQATIRSAEKENERYKAELAKSEENRKEKKRLEADIGAYLFIEDAFSNKGIPAIELRESAPEIADIANKILHESYGNKFDLRFGSTSELKAKRKADEDFNIIVYDSENGDEKTIDQVSSGERIWLKQALFYAFSIVQMNRTGFNFRTRLIDESDGSLDGTLRPKYLQMVTAAHKVACSRLTILITHSQEIKDIAEQVIEI